MRAKHGIRLFIALAALVLCLLFSRYVPLVNLIVPTFETEETVHSPIFSASGDEVYFFRRVTAGVTWGPGIRSVTPPAVVFILSDRVSIEEMSVRDLRRKTLREWKVPHARLLMTEWRGRGSLFGFASPELKREAGGLAYKIGIPRVTDSSSGGKAWSAGFWNSATNHWHEAALWSPTPMMAIPWNESAVFQDQEVVAYQMWAIVSCSSSGRLRVLYSADRLTQASEAELRVALREGRIPLHRAEYERSRDVRETYERLLATFRSQGMNEAEALLAVADEMQRLGYYPARQRLPSGP